MTFGSNVIPLLKSLIAGYKIILRFLSNEKYLDEPKRPGEENEVRDNSQNSFNYCNWSHQNYVAGSFVGAQAHGSVVHTSRGNAEICAPTGPPGLLNRQQQIQQKKDTIFNRLE